MAAGAAEEVRRARAAGASRTARKALGFDELLDGRRRGAQEAQPQLRQAPAHLDAQAGAAAARPGGHERDRARAGRRGGGYRRAAALLRPRPEPGVECRAVRFEKWQALGNDYVIVEADALPFELTPERVRALCAPHTGVGSDGILLLSAHGGARVRGGAADLQPGRLGGRAVRQRGPRGRDVPAPLRLGRRRHVLDLHRRGRGAAADHGAGHLHRGHGPRAARRRRTSPPAMRTARGSVTADGRELAFQFVSIGQPAVRDRGGGGAGAARPLQAGPADRGPASCSPTAPTSRSGGRRARGAIRARIFERGVGETMSSGTGATGAAVAAVLRGPTAR